MSSVPDSGLARYRVLSPNAGVHVSPIALGAASIGDKWGSMTGEMTKESSFKLLDTYFDNGGNFIDTACVYQDGPSEEFIGEWAEKRGIRDQLFIATKYSSNKSFSDQTQKQKIMYNGNNAKNLQITIESSLKRLRTSYIDLFYVHWYDWETSIEEVIQHLNILVRQGKILYLGISNTPAWVVAKANAYARQHGLTPFSVYQGRWNVLDRSFEREITSMARAEGMGLALYEVLAAGRFRSDEEEERRRQTGENGRNLFGQRWERDEQEKKIVKALEKVAAEVGTKHLTAVAIAYVMHKATYVFPIIGGRKPEHLLANLEALQISLNAEQMKYLDGVSAYDPGFPHNFIGDGSSVGPIMHMVKRGHIDRQPLAEPIRPPVQTH